MADHRLIDTPWDVLKLEHITDVPDDDLTGLVHRHDVRLALDIVHRYDWVLMAPQMALVWVTIEILRVPDIDDYLKSAGEKMATVGWHIDQLLYAVCMVLRECPH